MRRRGRHLLSRFGRRAITTYVYGSWPKQKTDSRHPRNRHACGRRGLAILGCLSQVLPCWKSSSSRRFFIGHDHACLPCLPDCALADRHGIPEGDHAGRRLSFLGRQSVLARTFPGITLQRHCHHTICPRRVSRDRRLAANVAGQLVRRSLFRVVCPKLRGSLQRRGMLRGPSELSELARNWFRRDIFASAIPTSGTQGARRTMVVSL